MTESIDNQSDEPVDEPIGPADPSTYGKEVVGTLLDNGTYHHDLANPSHIPSPLQRQGFFRIMKRGLLGVRFELAYRWFNHDLMRMTA